MGFDNLRPGFVQNVNFSGRIDFFWRVPYNRISIRAKNPPFLADFPADGGIGCAERGHRFRLPPAGVPGGDSQRHPGGDFSGKLNPGDRIIETYWAKELGVSQGPVREAIRDLEAMGWWRRCLQGSRIRTLTEKDVRDNYSVRICLESKSIRDASSSWTTSGWRSWWSICAPSCWRWMTAPTGRSAAVHGL